MEGSILDFLGTELIGVMSPVSICMLLVVLLVSTLSPPSSLPAPPSQTPIVTAANLVYSENPSDSSVQKLEGALLNAAVFILLIAAVTFVLVLLYYYNFTNFLKHYMRFSAFLILTTMGGAIFLSIVRHFSLPLDAPTCFFLLLNFSALGVVSVFGRGVPIIITQSYTVILGIITAAWFTQLPEWTTWVLLVALAIYDLVAVLAPGGPLKILVELAQSRDDELPALVYEARPTVPESNSGGGRHGALGLLVGGVSDNSLVELQNMSRNIERFFDDDEEFNAEDGRQPMNGDGVSDLAEATPLIVASSSETCEVDEESAPLVEMLARETGNGGDGNDETASQGIKLGLGDFVFYSVLVGRAAMYDLMTVYACYLAIISGLACTLILLAVCRRALPALPISIALGVTFYFLTRLLMEPYVVQTSTNLLMF
ncbi:presenilin-like protein At1g08700 [Amaranthus tricolor]|uniref:presenilin-like protein At1g08700 n=1 Tax=Amaranthus tricolor TaxID=29722 RepID=UPI0025831A69|nr:presenilin-like protein At1g08700 [Amaranthus tricolor]